MYSRLVNLSLFFIVAVILLAACRKEQKPAAIYIAPYYMDHFAYAAGSYWVYFDSVSGRTDSIAVTDVHHVIPLDAHNPNVTNESYSFSLTAQSYNTWDTLKYSWTFTIDAPFSTSFHGGGDDSLAYGMNMLNGNPPVLKEELRLKENYWEHYYYKSELLQSLNVSGVQYDSVYRISVDKDSSNMDNLYCHNVICISAKAGFLSFIVKDNTINKRSYLLRSKILK